MIRKEDDEFTCDCDDCGDRYYGGVTETFTDFVSEIKENGWRIRKDGDGWLHLCPCCAEGT